MTTIECIKLGLLIAAPWLAAFPLWLLLDKLGAVIKKYITKKAISRNTFDDVTFGGER